MTSIRQALANARADVSPLCEFGHKQWVVYWSSRRGREQSIPTSYEQARRIRAARIAGIAAMDDPSDAGSFAEHYVDDGETIENAVRKTMNYTA
jgi:hypothetical protein